VSHAHPATLLLLGLVLPLWQLAGFADWWCHRATAIERTAGVTESWLHLLLMAQVGVPVVLALVLQPNAFLLAVGVACWLVHALTTWLELRYVVSRRNVRPFEQLLHSFLDVLPLAALLLLAVAAWPVAPDLLPRWRDPLPPAGLMTALLAGSLALNWLPLLEELRRCYRQRARLNAPPPPHPASSPP
jgi:hypothetical protein